MLTLEQLRHLLHGTELADDDIAHVRDDLIALADIIFDNWVEETKTGDERDSSFA